MFLTPSYLTSGERVPQAYRELERRVLVSTDRVLTPSHLERHQLTREYGVEEERVRVLPRGIDGTLLSPRARSLGHAPLFCSVGSIKRQKNTVGLIRLFHGARERHPSARLRIVGPIQDTEYAREVESETARLELTNAVEFTGHVPPEQLASVLDDVHVSLSASHCETFGRAIFETLASGIPNIAPAHRNAAAEYLGGLPYARFHADSNDALDALDAILDDYEPLSAMALEVGELFDDAWLGRLLAQEIEESEILAVADLDASISDPDSRARAGAWVERFHRHAVRAVCSTREQTEVLAAMTAMGVRADFVVGSRMPRGTGEERPIPASHERSKLCYLVRWLRRVDWHGRVRVFGEGRHDPPLFAYFDGTDVSLREPSAAQPARGYP